MEGRKADADTHLAAARSQNTGTGISGDVYKKKGRLGGRPFCVEENTEKWYDFFVIVEGNRCQSGRENGRV